MRDGFFSDMSWLFFATWSVIVAAVSYAAFRRDLQPSKAVPSSGQISSRAAKADTTTR
jgi:hypothetical protein